MSKASKTTTPKKNKPKAVKKSPSKKPGVKKVSGKNPLVKAKASRRSSVERSFDDLISVWLSSTIDNKACDFNEIFNRLNTIFRVTCDDLDVSCEQAEDILWTFGQAYREMRGEEDYVCPDCQLEHDELEKVEKAEKLLN